MSEPRYAVGNNQSILSDQTIRVSSLNISSVDDIVMRSPSNLVAENHHIGSVAGYFSAATKDWPTAPENFVPITKPATPSPQPYPSIQWTIPSETTYIERFPFSSTITSTEVGNMAQPGFSYRRAHGVSSQTHGYVTAKSFNPATSPSPNPSFLHPGIDAELRAPRPSITYPVSNTNVFQTVNDIERFNFSNQVDARSVGDLSAPGGSYDQQPGTPAPTIARTILSATTHSSESQAYINIQAFGQSPFYGTFSPSDKDEVVRYPFAISDGVAVEIFDGGSGATRHGSSKGVSSSERAFFALRVNTPEPAAAAIPVSFTAEDSFMTYDLGGSATVQSFPFAIVPAAVTDTSDLDYASNGGYNGAVQTGEYGYVLSKNPDNSVAQKFPFAIPFATTDVTPIVPSPSSPGYYAMTLGWGSHGRSLPNPTSYFLAAVNTTQSREQAYIEALTLPAPTNLPQTVPNSTTDVHSFPFASETNITVIGDLINNDFIGVRGNHPYVTAAVNFKASNQD